MNLTCDIIEDNGRNEYLHYPLRPNQINLNTRLNMTKSNIPRYCEVENCEENARYFSHLGTSIQLCNKHYIRLQRNKPLNKPLLTLEARFWKFVKKTNNSKKCWEWTGYLTRCGYPQLTVRPKTYRAHRVSFYLHNGYWAKGYVLHSCDNRKCVNPNHLREGTHTENMQEMVLRNRQAKGENISTAILDTEKVKQIKMLVKQGKGNAEIAKIYNLKTRHVWTIATNKSWSHVKI